MAKAIKAKVKDAKLKSAWTFDSPAKFLVCLDRNPNVPGGRNVVISTQHIVAVYHKAAEPEHSVVVCSDGKSYDVDEEIGAILNALMGQ